MRVPQAALALSLAAGLQAAWAGAGQVMACLAPDFIRVQFAGNAGMLSGGAGYSWWDGRVEPSVNIGYVPAFAGGRASAILSQKTSLSPFEIAFPSGYSWEPVVLGGAANISLGRQYEVILKDTQRGYYWPDGLFFWYFLGTKARYRSPAWRHAKALAMQFEAGSINQYWEAGVSNRSVTWSDVISFSISSQIYF